MSRARLNVPNVLSLSRVVLAGLFVIMHGTPMRALLIGVASVTDFLDGWIARHQGETTRWGALVDPLADRVFVFAAVCTYLFRGELTAGQYLIFLSRDIATALGFVIARFVTSLRPVKFQARMSGKIVTVIQLATLLAVLFAPKAVGWLVAVIGIASAISIVDYSLMLWRAREQ